MRELKWADKAYSTAAQHALRIPADKCVAVHAGALRRGGKEQRSNSIENPVSGVDASVSEL